MAKQHKVYRFRMRPTKAQEQALNRMAGARRWVWNWGLERRREHSRAFGKTLSYAALCAELVVLKTRPETTWLREADSQALQQALKDLCQAFTSFFERRARFPKFKSRKRDQARFRIPQRVKVADGAVVIPKIGSVRIRQSRPIEDAAKSATFKRDATGRWFVTLTTEFELLDVPLLDPDPARIVGIDLGLIAFATISDGADPIPAPRFYRQGQRKLRQAQRALSRRKRESRRRAKAKLRVARIHQRIANQRGDFLHKLTTDLVRNHDGLCIEDLSLEGLARTKLARSFMDASMGEFRRQIEYKSRWNRKHLVVIDRFFPSSRMCNVCGALNDTLTLSDREWDCDCGTHHQRDFLAAINIRNEGLRMLAVGQMESRNAQGDAVRPDRFGLVSSN